MTDSKVMTEERLRLAVSRGARFIVYEYCISLIVISFARHSKPLFVPPGVSAVAAGWKYTALTLLLGWWGFPFGIIFSIKALLTNLRGGGKDVTDSVMAGLLYGRETGWNNK